MQTGPSEQEAATLLDPLVRHFQVGWWEIDFTKSWGVGSFHFRGLRHVEIFFLRKRVNFYIWPLSPPKHRRSGLWILEVIYFE